MDVLNVLVFLFFSAIEWLALIILTFAIFKFQLPGYWGRLLLSSFFLSLLSYMIFFELDLSLYGPLVQMPIVFLYFWQNFRIPIFYAALMVVNGYVLYTLIQAVILNLLHLFGIVVTPGESVVYVIQAVTSCIVFALAWLLIRTNWGFTFVPDTDRAKIKWNKLNVRLLVMSVIGYVANSAYNFLYYVGFTPLIILILGTVIFGFLQYLVFKREYQEYG